MDPLFVTILVVCLGGLAAGMFFVGRSTGGDPAETARLREAAVRAETELEERRKRVAELEERSEADRKRIVELSEKLSARETEVANWERRFEESKGAREEESRRLTKEFENLAHRILETSSKKVAALQEERMGEILRPVTEKFTEFQKSVRDLREQGISNRQELKTQLEHLRETGNTLGDEARNLTQALRGQKSQGMWGEFILERVLETSGLRKGEEYEVQESYAEGGSRLQPDVVVYLPEGKHLVIDAKVSLTAFLRFNEASSEEERKTALKEHLASVRSHVDGLAGKGYDAIGDLRSPEIVLLFVPVEPAFIEALRADPSLFDHAFRKKIVLVTPTTLLATLKTVASIWRQEKQNRHALEIARLGGELYDKFVGFTADLDEIGKRLEQAREAHEAARSKLVTGRGNAVRTIQRMKDLGLKTKKELDPGRIETALQQEEAEQ
mgnify:CR=1 FL=1